MTYMSGNVKEIHGYINELLLISIEHDGPVSVVQMSDNGLKILAGTCTVSNSQLTRRLS